MTKIENNEIVVFKDGELKLDVAISKENDTVWLSAMQISSLFERDYKTIRKHVNNVFKEKELDIESNSQKMRLPNSDKPVEFYSLDGILKDMIDYDESKSRGRINI